MLFYHCANVIQLFSMRANILKFFPKPLHPELSPRFMPNFKPFTMFRICAGNHLCLSTGAALTSVEKRRYVLDTNVTTLILDGELWACSSASLIYYRPSYGHALRKADYRPMEAFHHNLQVCQGPRVDKVQGGTASTTTSSTYGFQGAFPLPSSKLIY